MKLCLALMAAAALGAAAACPAGVPPQKIVDPSAVSPERRAQEAEIPPRPGAPALAAPSSQTEAPARPAAQSDDADREAEIAVREGGREAQSGRHGIEESTP